MRPTSSDSCYGEESSEKKPKTARKHRSFVKKDISMYLLPYLAISITPYLILHISTTTGNNHFGFRKRVG